MSLIDVFFYGPAQKGKLGNKIKNAINPMFVYNWADLDGRTAISTIVKFRRSK